MAKARRYANSSMQALLALVLSCALSGTAWAQAIAGAPTPRIIGGTTAASTAYPWAVALLQAHIPNAYYAQFCAGSLIDARWVLTAAHCVDDAISASAIEVSIGIADLGSVGASDRHALQNIYVHPGYDADSQDNDIALLELAAPVTNATVGLADDALMATLSNDAPLTIIGWGSRDAGATLFPTQLQETEIPLFGFASCNDIYGNRLTPHMLCAGYAAGGQDTCSGDSGGPLLYNTGTSWALTGITSFGNGCAQPNYPGVYTRVASFSDWISATTNIALPSRQRFGYHGIGHSSDTSLSLSNYSGSDIIVNDVRLTTSSQFSLQSENCAGTVIADNGSCSIVLRFLPTGAGTQLATLTADLGDSTSLSTELSGVGLSAIDGSALEDTSLSWFSGGNAPWSNSVIANSNGGSALRSGVIGNSQASALVTYVTGPTSFSFRWKASTEAGYDVLNFYVDGNLNAAISGEADWAQTSLTLGSGEHRLSWAYTKDSSASSGLDSVWLDSVNIPYSGSGGSGGSSGTGTGGGFGSGGGGFGIYWLLLLLLFHVMTPLRPGRCP